jgi:hypothetical protein
VGKAEAGKGSIEEKFVLRSQNKMQMRWFLCYII